MPCNLNFADFKGKEYKADGTLGTVWDAETETGYRRAVQCYEQEFANYTTEDQPIAVITAS